MDKRIGILSGAAFAGVLVAGFVAQAAGIPERGEREPSTGGSTIAADTRATAGSELVASSLQLGLTAPSPSNQGRSDDRDGDHRERERGHGHDEDDDADEDGHEERDRRGHDEDDD